MTQALVGGRVHRRAVRAGIGLAALAGSIGLRPIPAAGSVGHQADETTGAADCEQRSGRVRVYRDTSVVLPAATIGNGRRKFLVDLVGPDGSGDWYRLQLQYWYASEQGYIDMFDREFRNSTGLWDNGSTSQDIDRAVITNNFPGSVVPYDDFDWWSKCK